jgi:two-component system, NarL family, sensor kinase
VTDREEVPGIPGQTPGRSAPQDDPVNARAARVLFAVVVAEVVAVVVGWAATDMSAAAALDSFMVPNAVIGLCCGLSGGLIATQRPDNRLGWLLLGAALFQTATAAVTPWLVQALANGTPARGWSTAYSAAWPWSVALFIPLALLSFPDARPPRPLVPVVVGNAVLQVLLFSSDPDPLATVAELDPARRQALSYLAVDWAGAGWLDAVSGFVLSATYLAALVVLVLRYRRGTEQVRRQLLWLLLATAVAVALIAVTRLIGNVEDNGFPVILFTVVALVPAAMAIAVLRHGLLDIRLLWSRALTYAALSVAVAVVYLVLVAVSGRLLGFGTSVLATLLVAVAFNPARVRVQRGVDRLLYGDRADPVRAATTVSARLAGRPADVLPALCQALRLPYARLGEHEHGERPPIVEAVALHEGELEVGVRAGERTLHAADRAVLDLLAVPIAVALRAEALSAAVQASRRAIVEGREEERRRLRRDLHDGLGPVLTGIAFQADAVVNLAATDPAEVRALGGEIRGAVSDALADLRHLIYQLRPAALDEWGLVEAVRRHAQRLAPLHTRITADALPALPAAVEVAAYRIVTEALTNVARHSTAACAEVVITPSVEALHLAVRDDGAGSLTPWTPGVGLRSLRERAAELGGRLEAAPTPSGGEVSAWLPVLA